MGPDVDRPLEFVHRIVDDRLAEVAVRLKSEAGDVARREGSTGRWREGEVSN